MTPRSHVRTPWPRGAAVTALACAGAACAGPPEEPADLVLAGGDVVTADASRTVAEAIAVRGDRIVAVGSDERIRRLVGPDTRVVELAGRSVIPGLADNHFHSIGGGPGVDLSRARSLPEALEAIAERATLIPPDGVVVTNGDWHEGQLTEQRLPYRDDLDRAVPDRAVVVVRGGHEYVLNSAGLRRWGIDESTRAPEGGRLGRYAGGRLNGELVDRAKDLVELPDAPRGEGPDLVERLAAEHRELNRLGLTSVRYPGVGPETFRALRTLADEGRLNVRVEVLFRARVGDAAGVAAMVEAWGAEPEEGDEWLRVGGVKLGVDGGFEGGWMSEPYREPWGEGGTFRGLRTVPAGAYVETVRELNRLGWRVATHAVGDAALDLVLDAYEAADRDRSIGDRRWALEHGFIVRPEQLARLAALGAHVSAQDHLYVAAPSLVTYWGEARTAAMTPLRTYLDAGLDVSLGTDSPVIPENPFWALHHFTTRGTISAGVVGPDEAISRQEALRAATWGYARLAFAEEERGTLEPGKLADLAVLAGDYLGCADPCLETMEVDLTVVGGRIAHER